MSGPDQKPLVIPVFIPHAGCPHQCAFCNQSIITQKKETMVDAKSIASVIEEFLQYKGRRKQVELAFFGGNFLGLPERVIVSLLETVQPYIQDKKIDSIRFSTRPDTITPEMLSLIKPYPVRAIELGVQSMDDEVLAKVKRGHTCNDTRAAIALLKKMNFKVGVQIMAGLPGDTRSSLLSGTRDVATLLPDFARIYPLVVLKGSLLEQWFNKGTYHPLDLETSVQLVKQMYLIFSKAGIEVIRMGLQASDFMEDKTRVIAGPWHPAFGHLVFSSLMYDRVCEKMDTDLKLAQSGPKVLKVNPRSESRLRGNKNENIKKLHARYPLCDFSILKENTIPNDQVCIQNAL